MAGRDQGYQNALGAKNGLDLHESIAVTQTHSSKRRASQSVKKQSYSTKGMFYQKEKRSTYLTCPCIGIDLRMTEQLKRGQCCSYIVDF